MPEGCGRVRRSDDEDRLYVSDGAGTQLSRGSAALAELFRAPRLGSDHAGAGQYHCVSHFLQPAGFVPGAVLMALELYLAWVYRKAYCPMLAMRAKPGAE